MTAAPPVSVLLVPEAPALAARLAAAGFKVAAAAEAHAAADHDCVLLDATAPGAAAALLARGEIAQAAYDSACVALVAQAADALEADLLRLGVEAVLTPAEAATDALLVRALHHAVLRKQVERSARTAYATDLATGLPHQAQLLEHMTQLLALREREPAPMVLLVLRVEGFASAAARLGGEAANVLRRKVAVRLRSGLRASDVVAALGSDGFGVLLGHVEALADGERVAAKLARALQQPIIVAGRPCSVAAAVGLALYPDHGKDAQTLMQRASAQAGSVATVGREGYAGATQRIGGAAANDDAS